MIACICGNDDAYAHREDIVAQVGGWVSDCMGGLFPSIGTALAQARSDSSTLENAHKPRLWCQCLCLLLQQSLTGMLPTGWHKRRTSIDRLVRYTTTTTTTKARRVRKIIYAVRTPMYACQAIGCYHTGPPCKRAVYDRPV